MVRPMRPKFSKKNCCSINNAVFLSSLAVAKSSFPNFSPSLIFQGCVNQRTGTIHADVGAKPIFSQLYAPDSNLEGSCRFGSLTITADMSQADKNVMKNHLETVHVVIHEINPFVRYFKQIVDIPDEEFQLGKIVISADSRPGHGHARVYNVKANLQELSIFTNEKPHDLILQLCGCLISDLNPKAMPLNFTLLFVNGTYGWDQFLRHMCVSSRVLCIPLKHKDDRK